MKGLARRMPWTLGALVLSGLSLIGVPGSVGFISKWYLISSSVQAGLWPVAILIVLSSLLAVVYIWKIVEISYLAKSIDEHNQVKDVPLEMLIPLWILVGLNFYFGLNAQLTTSIASRVSQMFLGGGG